MEETVIATTTRLQVIGFDFLTPLLRVIFGEDGLFAGFTQDGVLGFLGSVWSVYVVLAYICSFIFLILYIYASIEGDKYSDIEHDLIHAEEEAYAMKMSGGIKSDKFAELQAHLDSDNPNDWKLAIIEADIILDNTLKRQGYAGPTLGDRLKSISPESMHSIDDAWQAHKVRNQIAHAGADFVLTQKIARETIMQYERVFKELGVGEVGGGHH
jgi:hypothetical protein